MWYGEKPATGNNIQNTDAVAVFSIQLKANMTHHVIATPMTIAMFLQQYLSFCMPSILPVNIILTRKLTTLPAVSLHRSHEAGHLYSAVTRHSRLGWLYLPAVPKLPEIPD